MTSLDKVTQALSCKKPQEVMPVAPIVLAWAAKQRGFTPAQFISDPVVMNDSLLWARERFGYDAVFAFGGTTIEAEAMGSRLDYNSPEYPDVVEFAVSEPADILRLSLPDPSTSGRLPVLVEGISRMHTALGNDVPIFPLILGPATIASQLASLESVLYTAIDDWPLYESILKHTTDVTIRVAAAVAEAGATAITIADPSASLSIIPAGLFREAMAPLYKQIIGEIRRFSQVPVGFYSPGPALPVYPVFGDIGFDYVWLDYTISPQDARAALPDVCLAGNAKPYDFVSPSPDEFAAVTDSFVKTAREIGGIILSSGSEVPLDADSANIEAFVCAARC